MKSRWCMWLSYLAYIRGFQSKNLYANKMNHDSHTASENDNDIVFLFP